MNDILKEYPIIINLKMAWGEMDAFQHLNNVTYFRYFESSRMKYFEKIGYMESIEKDKIGPILAETNCRYKAPLFYPDDLSIGTRTIEINNDRFWQEYCVFSKKLNRIAAIGKGLLVSYDYKNGIKVNLPKKITDNILNLEKNNNLRVTEK